MPVAVSAKKSQSCTEPTGLPVQGYREKQKQNKNFTILCTGLQRQLVLSIQNVYTRHSEANLKYQSLKQKVHCKAQAKEQSVQKP